MLRKRTGCGANVTNPRSAVGIIAPVPAGVPRTLHRMTKPTRSLLVPCALPRIACAASLLIAFAASAQNAVAPAASGVGGGAADTASAPAGAAASAPAANPASSPASTPLVVPPAARSSVNPGPVVYGLLDVAAGRFEAPGKTRVLALESGAMEHSFIGIRGGDDLGGGLHARFGLETYVRINQGTIGRTAADPFWGRTAYVGFQGQFGTSVLGRLPTPLYNVTRQFNPFDESYGFSPAIRQWYEGAILGDARWNNSVGYSSPEPEGGSGWSWQVQYNAKDPAPGYTGNNVGASLLYASGPLLIGGAFQRVRNGLDVVPAGFDKQTAYQIGMSYETRVVRLYGQAGSVKTSATTGVRTHLYQLGAAAPISLGFALVSYGHANVESDAFSSLRRTFSVGYDYFLSKSTDVYALAMNERVSGYASANSVATGLRLRF